MSQRNDHRLANDSRRPTTIAGGISLRGALISSKPHSGVVLCPSFPSHPVRQGYEMLLAPLLSAGG